MSNYPSSWAQDRISNKSSLITKGATPTTYGFNYISSLTEGGARFVRGNNTTQQGKFDGKDIKYICKSAHEQLKRSKLKLGDVVVSIVGSVGASFQVDKQIVPANINQNVALIRPVQGLDSNYLQQVITSEIIQNQINRELTIQAQPSLSLKQVGDFIIPVPPLPEQQKIATILSSVDTVIEKTRAQIDKLKHLKTGMMQQLLTQGIGHTEFKDTPVGRIPKEWDVGTLDSFGVGIFDGDRGKEYPKENDFYPSEFCLFLSAKNVTKNGFLFNEMAFITQEKDKLLRKGKLTRGDIVITTRGTIGNIAFYSPDVIFENIRINSGMAIIRNKSTALSSEFLHLLMNSPIITEQTELLAFGSAQPQLTISIIKNLIVPKPNLDEQKAITSAVSAVNKKLQLANKKLDLLTSTKKALMQDLLTGKVSVKT